MGGFLGELGKRLAERWLTLLVLPGAFYLAVAVAARALGQGHALDAARLISRITDWAKTPVTDSTAGQIVLFAAILAGAAGVGMAAQGLGSAVEHLALAADWRAWPWPLRQLAATLTSGRRKRWDAAHSHYHQLKDQAEKAWREGGQRPNPATRHSAYRTRVRISPERPDRPTWCGDRIHAASVSLARDLNVNLRDLWPYLWLHLSRQDRDEITAARTGLTQAATLAGWAGLYALLALWWWPAALLAVILALTAWKRTRTAADTYAQLLQAASRLHFTDLASQFGIVPGDLSLPALGATITHRRLPTPPPAPSSSPPPTPAPAQPPDPGHPTTSEANPTPT